MALAYRTPLALAVALLVAGAATAQTPPAAPPAPPVPTGNAVLVNGQPITEAAVQRGLRRVPPAERDKARAEIIDYLVDNAVIDQHLAAQKVAVEPKDVDARLAEIQAELKKHGQEYAKVLQNLMLTEAELRQQVEADLRWERFATARATESEMKALFDASVEIFDGTMVRARHILVTAPVTAGDAAREAAKAKAAAVKKEIEDKAAAEVAKLPASADAAVRQKETARVTEAAFSAVAAEKSDCPSKKDGGDLNWFPRAGSMVEPFAKAAFAQTPGVVGEPVATNFGYHLILVTERKGGQPTKFEEVKEEVKEYFFGKLREQLLAQLRPTAQVTAVPVQK